MYVKSALSTVLLYDVCVYSAERSNTRFVFRNICAERHNIYLTYTVTGKYP